MRLTQSSIAAVLSAAIFAPAVHAQTPTPILPPIPIHLQFPEWYAYRYGNSRTGVQPYKSNLSDPAKVGTLKVKWAFPATGALTGGFHGSPIVVNDTVFIGGQNGYFYALEAVTGALKWQYPKASDPPLLGQDPMWKYGIQTAAAFWYRSADGAVIFGAQDPSLGPVGPHGSYGSARLFALDAKTGALIWKSDRIAEINGDTWGSTSELHQRIAHTYPLIFGTKVYIGIHNTADNPVQVGRVIAVELATGHIDPAFQFRAVGTAGSPPGTRGGGVWNAPAADSAGVYFTTGNTRSDAAGTQSPEPKPNHGLSMLRVRQGHRQDHLGVPAGALQARRRPGLGGRRRDHVDELRRIGRIGAEGRLELRRQSRHRHAGRAKRALAVPAERLSVHRLYPRRYRLQAARRSLERRVHRHDGR